ncbi:MAG: DNA mismatch repair endonuclease MutL [Ruminococcaceae bacterium]|nr:DNA mismatch repair endonuclease MutL [Oscillospiraceae bacterium]
MAEIKVLDKYTAELIAAGEVIERPASVIKELVENSIDAGASVITVEIKNGGISYMRVTDNGCGIERQYASTAFIRHATSKIAVPDDLNSIATLGFRGEALASICAVSHVEMLTKTADEALGTHLVCEAGEVLEIEDSGCPNGTTFIVRDIFYNVPARMKFLKKDVTEANTISGILDKIALSHPEISFRLIRDGKETLHTPGDNKLKSAVYAVYDKEFVSGLIPVNYSFNNMSVYGFISKPSASRPSRAMQNFFINGRFIRSKTATAALEEAFKGTLMVGKFPAAVLHIKMHFAMLDVNVHPAKLEVRFTNERPVFDLIYAAVKSALSEGDAPKSFNVNKYAASPFANEEKSEQTKLSVNYSASPLKKSESDGSQKAKEYRNSLIDSLKSSIFAGGDVNETLADKAGATKLEKILDYVPQPVLYKEPKKTETAVISESETKSDEYFKSLIESEPPLVKHTEKAPLAEKEKPFETYKEENKEPALPVKNETEPDIKNEETSKPKNALSLKIKDSSVKILGEAFSTYIICEKDNTLLLIDKHAAHERLIYEKLKQNEGEFYSQQLLVPITSKLDKDEYDAILMHQDVIMKSGFEIEDFGEGTVIIRSAPSILCGQDISYAVSECASYLASHPGNFNNDKLLTEYMDWTYHNIACRAAMKSGDKSTIDELVALAVMLWENPELRYCPHGRPIYMQIEKKNIEKEFGRIQ